MRRRLAWVGGALAGAGIVVSLSLVAIAAKERQNLFCVACHLHEQKLTRLTAAPSVDLAGFHHARDGQIGCIECHGGVGPARRATVWMVAAVDTARFLVGDYEEPTRMRLPIPDSECRRCHTPIVKPRGPAAGATAAPPSSTTSPAPALDPSDESTFASTAGPESHGTGVYHPLRDHDGVNIRCVRCHTVHTVDSDAGSHFISRTIVQPVCRECHKLM